MTHRVSTRRAITRRTALRALMLTSLGLVGTATSAQAQLFGGSTPFPATGGGPAAAPAANQAAPGAPVNPAPAITPLGLPVTAAGDGASGEFRGLWVDAYREGFKTPAQVDRLIADARAANINALVVQVRRRGDALYARSLEPRAEDPDLAPDFDPLAYLVERAHAQEPRIEVHAWIITTTIWGNQNRPPASPAHVYNQHGPGATGREDWLTRREDGATWSRGYFIDPGHPDAARYTADVALNIVREYDVDGLHLDYIRYPERADGLSWGYNDTNVARFNARHAREGRPAGNDPLWAQWRRDQVTALVRSIYLGALAIKPQVKISTAVIPWGNGPATDADWKATSAYTSVYQDWRGWLEEGIVDQVMPMNYFRESAASQGAWFDRWVAWQRDHAYGRHVIPGVALYLNDPAESISQIRRALAPGAAGNRAAGVILYSYGATRAGTPDTGSTPRPLSAEVWAALTQPGAANGGQPPFAALAQPPGVAWKSGNGSGSIILRAPGLDGARVDLSGPRTLGGETDGAGLFGALSLPPGRYAVTVRPSNGLGPARAAELDVRSGALAQLELP
ncbi:MAG: family 10 glycosylhydrolase [Gemmataceae bacterium]|nr:family 10 glycosylhydrolase [Gemmataceae bacterium]